MQKNIIIGGQCRIITQGIDKSHSFKIGEIVTIHKEARSKYSFWSNNGSQSYLVWIDDIEPLVAVIPHPHPLPAGDNKLPTWCELVPQERHQLLGELIDAMIYSGVAVMEVQSLITKFKNAGMVRSTILPHTQTNSHE